MSYPIAEAIWIEEMRVQLWAILGDEAKAQRVIAFALEEARTSPRSIRVTLGQLYRAATLGTLPEALRT